MISVNVSLTKDLSLFVDFEAKHKGYKSADEYLQSLIVEERKRRAIQELEAKLLKGLEGPMVEMDRAEWDSIRLEALEGPAD